MSDKEPTSIIEIARQTDGNHPPSPSEGVALARALLDLTEAEKWYDAAEAVWFEAHEARPFDPERAARTTAAKQDARQNVRAVLARIKGEK